MTLSKSTLEPDWGYDFGKSPQFEIRYVEEQGDSLYVLGISHSAIKLRDTFTAITRFDPQANPQDRLGETVAEVTLRVQSIMAYHTSLNRLNADMSAGLMLTGDWDGLLDILHDNGWSTSETDSHQWRDTLDQTEKLILTR